MRILSIVISLRERLLRRIQRVLYKYICAFNLAFYAWWKFKILASFCPHDFLCFQSLQITPQNFRVTSRWPVETWTSILLSVSGHIVVGSFRDLCERMLSLSLWNYFTLVATWPNSLRGSEKPVSTPTNKIFSSPRMLLIISFCIKNGRSTSHHGT